MKPRILVAALITSLVALMPSHAVAQGDQSRVIGAVTDASGGALPGATVTLRGGSTPPATVVTDGAGRYLTPWVMPGTYSLTFVLSGFETRSVTGVVLGPGQTVVLDQQLALAALSEIVEVKAPAPPPPPPPPPPLVEWPEPKRLRAVPVDREVLASVCGPRLPPASSLAVGRVTSHRDSDRQLLGPGDLLRINAGTDGGMTTGQNLVVRRRFLDDEWDNKKPVAIGEQTAGLVQIVEAEAKSSVALVVYACSEIIAGDSVEKYAAQPAFFAVAEGTPRFDEPARITFGEHGQMAAASGQMMVIDRGIMQGAARGQRLTIFRREPRRNRKIGDAVIIAIRADSATIKIERSIDAVTVGDLVALHR